MCVTFSIYDTHIAYVPKNTHLRKDKRDIQKNRNKNKYRKKTKWPNL